MIVTFDTSKIVNELKNIAEYSIGFLDGAEAGKTEFLNNFGSSIIESLKNFVDTNARISPETLHHVYEWYRTGSPEARLFDIDYIIRDNTLSFNYTFSQSQSYSKNSTKPFYDKARVMEEGTPVIIKPRPNGVISFDNDGEQVFTRKPVMVQNPGGQGVERGFENALDTFFNSYFTQSFIVSSGLEEHFGTAKEYKNNFVAGSKQGKSLGFRIGYQWVSKGGKID